jgi:hypothetical protein
MKNANNRILCLFSGMNRRLFQSLLTACCFCGIIACRQGNTRHKIRSSKESSADLTAVSADSSGKAGVFPSGLDTALLSLKSFKVVALTDVLAQDWTLEDADRQHWNEIFWDSLENKRKFPGINLFKDFSVTANARCRIQMGKWQVNKERSELVLQFPGGLSQSYIIRKIALKQLELIWKREKDSIILRLLASAIVHKRPGEDPLYPLSNQWRISPKTPETNEQIRLRVKNCVKFYSLFFRDNHQRQETDISYIGLPTCFIWYNGGIGLSNKIDLDKKWIACFYSEDQALKGYDMLADLLQRHVLKWPEHPTSWVKQEADVLDQLYDKL